MRAVDEEHSRERAATLEKAAAEDAKAFAEERARKSGAARQERRGGGGARARRARGRRAAAPTEYDDALAAVWRGKVQEAEGAAHSKARETLLAEIEAAANERDDAPRLATVFVGGVPRRRRRRRRRRGATPTYAPSTQAQELTQELEACTSKIATKMNRARAPPRRSRRRGTGLRCAAALEGDQLDAGPCALLEAAVVRRRGDVGVRGAPTRESSRAASSTRRGARAGVVIGADHADGCWGTPSRRRRRGWAVRGGVGGAGDDRRQARDELDAGARCSRSARFESGAVRRPPGGAIRAARVASKTPTRERENRGRRGAVESGPGGFLVRAAVVLAQGRLRRSLPRTCNSATAVPRTATRCCRLATRRTSGGSSHSYRGSYPEIFRSRRRAERHIREVRQT